MFVDIILEPMNSLHITYNNFGCSLIFLIHICLTAKKKYLYFPKCIFNSSLLVVSVVNIPLKENNMG